MAKRTDADIESFAELVARLDDPFADRASILRSAGLDEAAYLRRRALFSADLAGATTPELAQRFGETYARVVQAIAAARRGGDAASPTAAKETNAEPPPRGGDTAPIPWVPEGMRHFTSLQETQPATSGPPAEALPFVKPAPGAVPLESAKKQPEAAQPRPAPPGLDETSTTHAWASPPARPVLPFEPQKPPAPEPLSPTSAPPGKRLIRFDSQTGEPLPSPVWVDIPTPPERKR